MTTTPNPGSKEARAAGCRCPVIDNGHGRGRGDGLFWVSEGCQVHASKLSLNPESQPVTINSHENTTTTETGIQ